MRRRGTGWLLFGMHVPGEALFAFVGGGLAGTLIGLAAAVLGSS